MNELDQVPEVATEGEAVYEDTDNLFEDVEDSTDTPVEESEATEESSEPVETETTEEKPFGLTIKFNGEEKTLTEEEARTLAQKGMNYDRFYEPIERLARLNNMSVGDYLNRLNDTQINYEVSQEIENMRQDPKYDGVSDEVLEEIANTHVMERIGVQEENYAQQQKGIADAEQARVQRDVDMFLEEYPEFKNKEPDALDPKVFDYVNKGYTLLEAYNKWSREQSNPKEEAKAKNRQLNEENKKRSLGNTTNAGGNESDDFLSGFFE